MCCPSNQVVSPSIWRSLLGIIWYICPMVRLQWAWIIIWVLILLMYIEKVEFFLTHWISSFEPTYWMYLKGAIGLTSSSPSAPRCCFAASWANKFLPWSVSPATAFVFFFFHGMGLVNGVRQNLDRFRFHIIRSSTFSCKSTKICVNSIELTDI